jgi:adenosine kinase
LFSSTNDTEGEDIMTILISGSLAYDRIMDFPGKFSDNILPDKIHILNVCFTINGLRENYGGTAGNIGYTLALLEERPLILAAAGRDFGPYRAWLEEQGLSTDQITMAEEELTACAYITTDLSDNQITAFNPGAMKRRAELPDLICDPTSTVAIVSPGNLCDMRELPHHFRRQGVPFIFDPGQSLPGWSGDDLAGAIKGAAVFISNDYELELTLDRTRMCIDDLRQITGAVVTTRGEYGSLVRYRDGCEDEIPAVPPERVADPTGAGDAYRAGFIKGLVTVPGDLARAARLGATAAAYAVEVYGTQTFSFDRTSFNTRHREMFGQDAY